MAEMLKHYYEYGFTGPLQADHAPAMYGETKAPLREVYRLATKLPGKYLQLDV
jgi:D-mannonate dehydratase